MLVEGVTAAMDPALHDDDANLDMLAPSRDPGLSSTAGAPVPEGIIANTVRISVPCTGQLRHGKMLWFC